MLRRFHFSLKKALMVAAFVAAAYWLIPAPMIRGVLAVVCAVALGLAVCRILLFFNYGE